MNQALRATVRTRSGGRCEYCLLPETALGPGDFHAEHVIARCHGGGDGPENLAWACAYCNVFKGPNLSGRDPDSGELVRLFNPRDDLWADHFLLQDDRIAGRTAIGRTTVWVLRMNQELMLRLRASLRREGRFGMP